MGTETERYYHHRAGEYDSVYDKPERQPDLASLRSLIVDTLGGRRVLELAAGTGYWTQFYADTTASVLATDLNDATLDVARNRRMWPRHVDFRVADAFELGSIEGEFDAVFAGFLWSHIALDRLDEMLSGIKRRLGIDSVIAFADNNYVHGSNHPIARTDDDGNTYQQRRLENGSDWEVMKNFPSPDELRQRLASLAGDVHVEPLEYFWFATAS